MILSEPRIDRGELHNRLGWELKPEGACKGAVCVPLPPGAADGDAIDARILAERLGMPLVHDQDYGLWALGPESLTGRALTTAEAPDLRLPDLDGNLFSLAELRGQKVVLAAWASW